MLIKAIVIKKQNTSEYDQWVTCYTEEFGKLKTVAKSILKPSSIQALHLDIFNLVEFELVGGSASWRMPIITGAQVTDSFSGIKSSLAKTAVAYFFVEALDKMVFENDKDDELWVFLTSFLTGLDKDSSNSMRLFRRGQVKLLDILGYFPEVNSCKSCNGGIDTETFGAFNHAWGGIICKRCFLDGQGGILINQDDFSLLKLNFNNGVRDYRRSVLDGMFEYVSGAKFYSLELMSVVK